MSEFMSAEDSAKLDEMLAIANVSRGETLTSILSRVMVAEAEAKRLRTLLEAPSDEVVNAVADAIQKEGETYAIIPGYAYARLARAALSALNKAGLET